MVAAVDGSARLAARGTPTDLVVQTDFDREMVGVLLDAAANAALGDGKGDGHASYVGKLSLSRHRAESIGRHPRKVRKSHETGSIPIPVVAKAVTVEQTVTIAFSADGRRAATCRR